MGRVRFVTTTSAGYSGITSKDKDTLYFISDERRIYKGEVPYSSGIFTTVAEFPETGEVNTLYVNSATGEVRYYNGTSYQTVVPATGKSITGKGDGSLATTAAVAAYVTSQIGNLNISTLKGRVDTLEGEMDTAQAALDGIAEGVYPVGSLYFNATDATNPHDLLGFGTWAAFGQGRMLLSASDSHKAGATGGSETVTLTAEQMPGHTHTATTSSAGAHTHTATTSSAGAHTHSTMAHQSGNEVTGYGLTKSEAFVNRPMLEDKNQDHRPLWTSSNGAHSHSLTTASAGAHTHTLTTASAGGGRAHDNMPPFISVYIWVRTA